MSKQTLTMAGILFLGFASGISLGLFLGSAPAASEASEKNTGTASSGFFLDAAAQDRVQANTLLSDRIRELEKELAEQKKAQDSIMADRLAFFRKYHDNIRFQAFENGSLKVTPSMAELLGITKEEEQAVEQHLRAIQSEMDKIEDSNTTVAKQTANGITYDIAADARGKALKDTLTQSLKADLGDDRADVFINNGGFSTYMSDFSGFAEQKREIQINWMTQNGKQLYTWRENYGSGSAWSDTPEANLPGQYQKYLPTGSAPAP